MSLNKDLFSESLVLENRHVSHNRQGTQSTIGLRRCNRRAFLDLRQVVGECGVGCGKERDSALAAMKKMVQERKLIDATSFVERKNVTRQAATPDADSREQSQVFPGSARPGSEHPGVLTFWHHKYRVLAL